ncbi:DoxX family protein [Methylobacterium mesophilicum]
MTTTTTTAAAIGNVPSLGASTSPTRFVPLVGRFLMGTIFLASGLGKIAAPAATIGYIQSAGLPAPQATFALAVVVEVGGAVLLVAGYRARLVALVLALFSVATAIAFHAAFADQNQMIHFLKNLAMAGGLLQVVAFGAGGLSLDARTDRA